MAYEYYVSYRKDGVVRREPFGSELAALGRVAALMRAGGASDLAIFNALGIQIHGNDDVAVVCGLLNRGYHAAKPKAFRTAG